MLNKENPWLSIIMPVYNAEKYLSKALNSIKTQSFKQFEVIIIDDGSTDKSPKICKDYYMNDARFTYHRIRNSGAMEARCIGMKYVRGNYFMFCDSDDYYINNNAFQILYDTTNSTKNPFSIIQFSHAVKYNHLAKINRKSKYDFYVNADEFEVREYPQLLCNTFPDAHLTGTVWDKLYYRQLIQNIETLNENNRVFWGEDLILNMHLLSSVSGAYFIPKVLYVYRENAGKTKDFSTHTMEDLDVLKKYQLRFLDKRRSDSSLNAESIEKGIFSEMAVWLFLYVRNAATILSEEELKRLIENILELESFKLAREYYLKHKEIKWQAVSYLREANVEQYMKLKDSGDKQTIKQRIISVMKMIYKRI